VVNSTQKQYKEQERFSEKLKIFQLIFAPNHFFKKNTKINGNLFQRNVPKDRHLEMSYAVTHRHPLDFLDVWHYNKKAVEFCKFLQKMTAFAF